MGLIMQKGQVGTGRGCRGLLVGYVGLPLTLAPGDITRPRLQAVCLLDESHETKPEM